MKKRIRVGFLGGGSWGQTNLLPATQYIQRHHADRFDVEIAALCKRDPQTAKEIAGRFGIPRIHHDLEDFAADETLDCYAVVMHPRGLRHVVDTLRRRGVPIFTEKPPGFTYEDARTLAETINVPNVVAFNRRYFPIVERFKQIIGPELDNIYYIDCNFYRHERYDSKLFKELNRPENIPFVVGTALHGVNVLEYFFGEITTCKTTTFQVRTNDTAAWLGDLAFDTGIKGRIKIFPCSGSTTEWIEAHSQMRSYYLHYCMYSEIDRPGEIRIHEGGKLVEVIQGNADEDRLVTEGFVGEWLDFFQAVTDGSPTRSNFQNAANSMRISDAIDNGEDVG